ncbi:MAG: family 78 glycoside hydrolase catalytic domain [Alistipes sp.]|nr:family 78 glycoside hydrolase catalytic domain [Alistipes sp.]
MKRILSVLWSLAALLCVSCSTNDGPLSLYDLRCEDLTSPLAVDSTQPHLSWKIKADAAATVQTHYEIMVATSEKALRNDEADLWSSGKVASDKSVMVPYAGKSLSSRTLAYWKVRVWDNYGNVSAWSDVQRFGIGILTAEEWQGEYIGLKDCTVPQVRRKFDVKDKSATYLLHVNSLGYHEVYLNGEKVSDAVLAPAVSEMAKRSLAVTYDLTPLLKRGENDLMLWLGRGWYREDLYADIVVNNGPLVKVELDAVKNGKAEVVLVSDASWKARQSEYGEVGDGTWRPHRFGGEYIDGRKVLPNLKSKTLDAVEWSDAWVTEVPKQEVTPQMCEMNVLREVITPKEIRQVSDSVWMVDMGKCMNGWVEIDFPAMPAGKTVQMEYSDRLNADGTFNPQDDKSRRMEYADSYIAAGKGAEIFRNKFNHHAFQYILIYNLPAAPEKLTGYLVSHDFKKSATFDSSDKDLKDIFSLIEYTFNAISWGGYIVDCPHYERMGYGGDGNASCRSFQTLYQGSPLYQNWMYMWEDCMREGGSLPHAVPNPYKTGGGPYWCSFVIQAPWQTYLNYGDTRLLERYYPLMQQWLAYVDAHSVDGLLRPWPNEWYRHWYLGDWIAPDGVDYKNTTSVDLVNNCVVSQSFDIMSKIATVLGKTEDAAKYKTQHDEINKLIHKEFFDDKTATYATGSQIDMSYPLTVGVAEGDVAERVKQAMFAETASRKGHMGVGLVGVTILTDWATDNCETEFMYSMLKKREYPGYLYMIDNGATTTWEYWNAGRSRIHNCFNGIGSWFIQAAGGILPDENAAGFKNVKLRPQLPSGVEWVKSSKETPYGLVRSEWSVEGDKMIFDIEIPANSTATFFSPVNAAECELNGAKETLADNAINLGSGIHKIVIAK